MFAQLKLVKVLSWGEDSAGEIAAGYYRKIRFLKGIASVPFTRLLRSIATFIEILNMMENFP